MKLATIAGPGGEETGAVVLENGFVSIARYNERTSGNWPIKLGDLIRSGLLNEFQQNFDSSRLSQADILDREKARFRPLFRHPSKIWGIGLNYAAHASDLSETTPQGIPASFMKPDTTIIGHDDVIRIPEMSEKTTAEAELGVVIGKKCKNVPQSDWLSVVAGFTCIIDMTAEDILRKNPRYLTLSKSFDTFFSFGPILHTPDEIHEVENLEVKTIINNSIHAANTVSAMTFPPGFLVSFHSRAMTLLPGDVISTGTPGAVPISDKDEVMCRITGLDPLINRVVDSKGK